MNPEEGIKKDGSVSVTLPFYTKLESKPCPNKPDQYIDWWRALRIYVYDDPGAIKHAYDCDTKEGNVVDCGRDPKHPEKPNAVRISSFAPNASPVPTCPACFAPLVVYRIQSGGNKHGTSLPAEDPSQLLEDTFAKVTASPEPLKIDYAFVDYDISSVDQVYMSVAMDPVNNPFIGFIGSALGRDIFSDTLTKFRNDFSWPKYKWPAYVKDQTAIRLPATFNVMNDIAHPGFIACDKGPCPPLFEPAGAAIKALPVVQKMEKLWDKSCGADWPRKPCPKPSDESLNTRNRMRQVAELFDNNYASYKKLCETPGKTPVKLDRDQMMANVYGWVPFKSCLSGGDVNNELKDTPGIGGLDEYRKISHAYVDLQYHSPPDPKTFGDFNRYTELIHSPEYLHVGEYAFSIDDAAGNMLEVGDGVNITVGGTNGLGNRNPYDPWRFFLFNVGAAKETGPTWTKYRVCTGTEEELTACASQAPDRDMKESHRKNSDVAYASIKIGAVQCPCVIVLEDSNKALYKVRVKKLPQPPPTHPINKEGKPPTAIDNSWDKKVGDDFVNVGCFGTETSFEWCGNLNASIAFDQAVVKSPNQRTVYHVNTSAPVVSKPGIRFEQGNVEGTLSPNRLSVTVKWPKAITQPPGRPVNYGLTLWNRANCPKDSMLCNGHGYSPVPACNASQTECKVVFSTMGKPSPNAPPLTADTLKSMSVTARANGIQVGKEANFFP